MNVIIHYPGKLHIEKECDYNGSFNSLWVKLINHINEMQQFVSMDAFFSRFLVYKNGTRLWEASTYCEKGDIIIIAAVNKGSVVPVCNPNITKIETCIFCNKEDAVFIDEFNILTNVKGEERSTLKAYCKECFTKAVREFAFNNIRKMEPLNGYTVDIGISGERDSTMAAYFLANYKEQHDTNIDIKGVYNNIGLGYYDDLRQKWAEIVANKYGFDFKVNHVDIGLLGDFYKHDTVGYMNTRYCNMCTYLTGFRNYGEYSNVRVLSATGARTLEDDFVSKIYGTYKDDTKLHGNRLYVLKGLSEDIISLYAAICNVNYCIADCPLQGTSPHYFCRKLAVNPLKAISRWVYKQDDEDTDLKDLSPFGYMSSKKSIPYFVKCIQRSDGEWVNLSNITMADYKDLGDEQLKARYCEVDILDKNFYDIKKASEDKWLKDEVEDFKVALNENEMKSQKLALKADLIILVKTFVLLYINKKDYRTVLISINRIEEYIINKILETQNSEMLTIGQLNEYFTSHNYDEYSLSLYRLMIYGVVYIPQGKGKSNRHFNVVLCDKYKLLDESDRSELLKSVNSSVDEVEFIYCTDEINDQDKSSRFAICISTDMDDLRRFESILNKSNSKAIKIFVHVSEQLTILRGSFTAFDKKYAPIDLVVTNNEIDMSTLYKKQVIYILLDMMSFEDRANLIEKPNVLTVINLNTMQKKQINF